MAYADDLLRLAREIANLHPGEAHQPSLRRALSTAYYALFHLLIADAVASCGDPQLRAVLSRMFDHGPMRQASTERHRNSTNFLSSIHPKGRSIASRIISMPSRKHSPEHIIIATKPITILSENGSPPKYRCSSKKSQQRSIAGRSSAKSGRLGITSFRCFPAETRSSPKKCGQTGGLP